MPSLDINWLAVLVAVVAHQFYGLITSTGFVEASIATTAVFENRKITVPVLFATYQVLGITIMGAILGAWR